MIIYLKNKHTLKVDNFYFKCSIGKNGLTKKKIEGDKKTPIGSFKLVTYIIEKIELKNHKHTYIVYQLKKIWVGVMI